MPKNVIDHNVFKISCAPNHIYAVSLPDFLRESFAIHTRNSAIPIRRYSADHTGPNISFGGMSGGFSSAAYQVGIFGVVKSDPIHPAAKVIKIDAKNFAQRMTTFCTSVFATVCISAYVSSIIACIILVC